MAHKWVSHVLHTWCHLILTIILYPQCFSLKLRLREVIPLTWSHTTYPSQLKEWAPASGFMFSHIEKSLAVSVERSSEDPSAGSEPRPLISPASTRAAPGSQGALHPTWGPRFSRDLCPWFLFRSRVHASFTRRLLAGSVVSVTRHWIASQRGPLCVLWMKNTPFRERIQLDFHRERRQLHEKREQCRSFTRFFT